MKSTNNSLSCCHEGLTTALKHTDCSTALIGLMNVHCATIAVRGYMEQAVALQAELDAVARTLHVLPELAELPAFYERIDAQIGNGKYNSNTVLNASAAAILSLLSHVSDHDAGILAAISAAFERCAKQVFALNSTASGCGADSCKVN